MATGARTGGPDAQPDGILIVVDEHLDNRLDETAGCALTPKTLTAAALVMCLAGRDQFL